MPMLANGRPLPVSAMPRDMASFLNVPSRWFTHKWFGVPSLAIKRSGHPSPVTSAAYTPSPGAWPRLVVVEVVYDYQVKASVPVVIDERGRGSPVRVCDTCLGRDVAEL